MAYNTYTEGLKQASDLANKAITTEASLSTLSPLVSPLPTLQKAFPLYIASAERYSHLLTSNLVPENDRQNIKKRWRLVLERAEKVKKRIEELGGYVGKVGTDEQGQEEAVRRRGGQVNGISLFAWTIPHEREFQGDQWREGSQPELAKEQLALNPIRKEVDPADWDVEIGKERLVVKQGPGADCSVVAGYCACLEHDRRWGTRLAREIIWPQNGSGSPKRSENGKHVVKLLLNGAWRGILLDALLPYSATGEPLFATSLPANPQLDSNIGPPWIPLIMKGYFKALGGYSLPGSNPSEDIYTLTGWLPEQLNFENGIQREKEWKRVFEAWKRGEVVVTLGTGEEGGEDLIPLHAYAVLGLKEESGERILEIYDPGIARVDSHTGIDGAMNGLSLKTEPRGHGLFTMTWDSVCAKFERLCLNWSPALRPVAVQRHWSWPKPASGDHFGSATSVPRYCLRVSADSLKSGNEVWIMLSQHITSKDRSFDAIALRVQEDMEEDRNVLPNTSIHHESFLASSPYSNSVHILVKHVLHRPTTSLTILPIRDQGLHRTDFTLQAFASPGSAIQLERMAQSLPFSASVSGALTIRNAGGHGGLPSWMDNPQYKLVLSPPSGRGSDKSCMRIMLWGKKEVAWNVKLLWGGGELVYEWSGEMVVADSGAYSYGMAFIDTHSVRPGTYTMVLSAFEPRQIGKYGISIESDLPVAVQAIPAEGAGMFSRTITGTWTEHNTGGRPSGGTYDTNPKMEITLPRECVLIARALLPQPSATPLPLNLTLYRRGEGGGLSDQIVTSGPYSDSLCGVSLPRTRLASGIYSLVLSPWAKGSGLGEQYQVRIWTDGPLEVESIRDK